MYFPFVFSYHQARASMLAALPRLHQLKVPTRRPDDYFAEMAKSDQQMQKVGSMASFILPSRNSIWWLYIICLELTIWSQTVHSGILTVASCKCSRGRWENETKTISSVLFYQYIFIFFVCIPQRGSLLSKAIYKYFKWKYDYYQYLYIIFEP